MSREVLLVDACGLRCPQPVIMLARAARSASAGTEVRVLSTDPAAGPDIAAWCRMRGHTLVFQVSSDDTTSDGAATLTSVVRLGADQPTRPG